MEKEKPGSSITWFMPFVKSHQEDDGHRIVEGVASTEDWDGQDEQMLLDGMDFGGFLKDGYINWNHKNEPRFVIGVPLEADVRVMGGKPSFYVKARLFDDSDEATYVWKLLQNLERMRGDGGPDRQLGWSIEGIVDSRHKENGRIKKCKINMVALTHEPVNANTWAMVAKSFSGNEPEKQEDEELVEGEPTDDVVGKALDSQIGTALRLENLDGGMLTETPREKKRRKRRELMEKKDGLVDVLARSMQFPSLYGEPIPAKKSLSAYTIPQMVTFLSKNNFDAEAEAEIIEFWSKTQKR